MNKESKYELIMLGLSLDGYKAFQKFCEVPKDEIFVVNQIDSEQVCITWIMKKTDISKLNRVLRLLEDSDYSYEYETDDEHTSHDAIDRGEPELKLPYFKDAEKLLEEKIEKGEYYVGKNE
jgi:hypothetical protein